jgi:transposase
MPTPPPTTTPTPTTKIKLTTEKFEQFKKEYQTIANYYKQEYSHQKPTNYQQYEKQWTNRLTTVLQEIENKIHKATQQIQHLTKPFGRPPITSTEQKALILLQKDLIQFSSRKMANLLPMFTNLNNVKTSYKTIQRAYSNPQVKLIIHNLFILLVKEKKIKHPHTSGDGTGYSLSVTRHYRSVREQNGETVKTNQPQITEDKTLSDGGGCCGCEAKKVNKSKKRKSFTYSFAVLDLESGFYVGYGVSLRSEKEAFVAALSLMGECGVEPASIRLDQYYAGQSTVELFGGKTVLYVIPKCNATLRGSRVWRRLVWCLMQYPFLFLSEYYKRERSESGFSADKRFSGWKIWQKREDRILTAQMLKGVWHNLIWLGG